MKDLVGMYIDDHIEVMKSFLQIESEKLVRMAEIIHTCFKNGGKLLIFGNGGSAADAQHIAAEFVGRFSDYDRKPLPAIALTTDTSVLTAVANDFGFEYVFSRQILALGKRGDVLLGISTSGESENVYQSLRGGHFDNLITLGFSGKDNTDIDTVCKLVLHVPSTVTSHIQECHIMAGHILVMLVEELMKKEW